MVSSISSAKQATQDYIQGITVDLSRAYIKSRLECAQAALDGEVDGMLTARHVCLAENYLRVYFVASC